MKTKSAKDTSHANFARFGAKNKRATGRERYHQLNEFDSHSCHKKILKPVRSIFAGFLGL